MTKRKICLTFLKHAEPGCFCDVLDRNEFAHMPARQDLRLSSFSLALAFLGYELLLISPVLDSPQSSTGETLFSSITIKV
jgi:hypothetical protein